MCGSSLYHSNILCLLTQGEVCCCGLLVCVVPSRFRRLSCGGAVFTSSALDDFSEWLVMVSMLRRGVLGSQTRSEPKECWQMRSRLMGGSSGCANSVLNQMCGRGGVAGDVTVTSRRGCKGSTGRRSLQKSGECSTGSSTSSGEEDRKARSLESEASIPSGEGGDSVDVWGEFMEVEDEAESRGKLDEQKKKLQKELRDVARLSFVTKEMQESIMESLQHYL